MGSSSGKYVSDKRLDGKTAVITGANTGIGRETAKDFFKRGARVILACRSLEKANAAAESIKQECKGYENLGQLHITQLDVSSLASVKKCALALQSEKRIDLLVNNAGVMMCPKGKTEDGFETHFGTNHLGHFYLTLLLLPKILQSTPARIINVSSEAHRGYRFNFDDPQWEKRQYSAYKAYQQSKLANILFTKELAKKLKECNYSGVTVYCLHPGVINTEILRHTDELYFSGFQRVYKYVTSFAMKTPEEGAQTTIYCALDDKCANESGLYYSCRKVVQPSPYSKDSEAAERLWNESLKLVGIGENYIFGAHCD